MVFENNILKILDLSAAYGNDVVLESASFELAKGQFVGLFGGNGSGKTTLLKIISGELLQKSGSIIYKNASLDSNSIVSRMKMGIIYIHQFPITFPDLFAWENFAIWSFALNKRKQFDLTKNGIIRFLNEKLSFLGLAVSLEKKVSDLSEGDLQILEFTRCFIIT